MSIIIFDTFGGLCNQFFDIQCGVNFCLIHGFKFSFRYCSFRKNDFKTWYNEKISKLFDTTIFNKYENYVDIETLQLTEANTYNFNGILSINMLTNNYLQEIKQINKPYIVLRQFCSVHLFNNICVNLYPVIIPSKRLYDLYNHIKGTLLLENEEYNAIHYRYEKDFTDHFKCSVDSLENIISHVKPRFKNPNLRIYIATSNIKSVIDLENPQFNQIIITKNESELTDYNFEELAFIDYMFCLNSNEIFGHNNSSFSVILNSVKNTNNYYNTKNGDN